jgi:hypothetical protein
MCTERLNKAIPVTVGILIFYVQDSYNHETGEALHITMLRATYLKYKYETSEYVIKLLSSQNVTLS